MPPITEARLYEAFGLTPPEGQGAQEQTPAESVTEPSTVETGAGEQVQELAEPAQPVETEQPTEPGAGDAGNGEEQPAAKPAEQTLQERAANAARRRQQEQQAAIEEALQAERDKHSKVMLDVFQKAGLTNTFTGKPITTMDEFNEWHQKFSDTKLQQDLQAGRLTKDGLNQLIEQNPILQQARQMVQNTENLQKEQQAAADQARIDSELAEIGKLDPTIKGVADLLNMPTAAQFKGYVDKGYSFLDAYKLANMDTMANARAQAAADEAARKAQSKSHLTATGNVQGAGASSVPPAQMAMFRKMNPGATDAQIQKFYNQYKKRQGG